MALTREQQIAALEKDWAENPRWKGVTRAYSGLGAVFRKPRALLFLRSLHMNGVALHSDVVRGLRFHDFKLTTPRPTSLHNFGSPRSEIRYQTMVSTSPL